MCIEYIQDDYWFMENIITVIGQKSVMNVNYDDYDDKLLEIGRKNKQTLYKHKLIMIFVVILYFALLAYIFF